MSKANKSSAFLAALSPEAITPQVTTVQDKSPEIAPKTLRKQAGKKHIGGYFEPDMVEKVAILRARLNLDNSELIKRAIEDLYKKHEAKRAFGDA
jgi:hypothetical protein